MSEKLMEMILMLVLALSCAVLGTVLRERKSWILAQLTALVQKAEEVVRGSGMGAEKKRLVLAQLEAMGVRVTDWMSRAIDCIVTALNEKRAWLTETAGDGLSEAKE